MRNGELTWEEEGKSNRSGYSSVWADIIAEHGELTAFYRLDALTNVQENVIAGDFFLP